MDEATNDRWNADMSRETREADDTWREIERLVGEVSALASRDSSPEDFYRGLLTRAVQALAARGGAIWTRSEDGRFRLLHQIQLVLTPFSADAAVSAVLQPSEPDPTEHSVRSAYSPCACLRAKCAGSAGKADDA